MNNFWMHSIYFMLHKISCVGFLDWSQENIYCTLS